MMTATDPVSCFAASPATAGLFLDFDGVLADISDESDGAVVRPNVPELLLQLQKELGRVAIISGRPVEYLHDMIPTVVDVVGLYGLEWRSSGRIHSLPQAEEWREVIDSLTDEAIREFGSSLVEHKGLSLTVHYRRDSGRADAMRAWADRQAEVVGLDARTAKQSFELHPPIDRDKGTAILELAESLNPVAFVGDDVGDLPAFDGLDVLAGRGVTTFRVVVESDESPREMIERADVVVPGPAGAEAMLRQMLDSLG